MTILRRIALAAGALGLLGLPLWLHSPAHQNTAILILMLAQLAVAWNILGGYAGQISLGHAAFSGIGAYTSAILLVRLGINPWLGSLCGALAAAAAGLLIGWPCFRLKGHYFAMATIAVAEIIQVLFSNWDYAGAAVGLTLPIDRDGWQVLIFADKWPYYYLALTLLGLTLLAAWLIEHSWLGFYFRAIKDEPDAARSLGVSLTRYKQVALLASSSLSALGGSLYALKELYIDPPSVLATGLSIKVALAAILGGVGTLAGPVIGAGILTLIEEATRQAFGGSGRGTDLIVYALLIIGIALYYPAGVLGWLRERGAKRARRT
jgi:branched-chain amino acid transport system permease protein